MGTAWHAGLECIYTARKEGRSPFVMAAVQAAMAVIESSGVTDWGPRRDKTKVASDLGHGLALYLKRHRVPDDWRIEAVEVPFTFPLSDASDWAVHGTIDLIATDPKGRTWVLDHKTANKPWPLDKANPAVHPQPAMYVVGASHLGYNVSGFCFRVWSWSDQELFTYPVTVTPRHIELLRHRVETVVTALDRLPPELLPPSPSHRLCSERWCDWWHICEFGAGRDKVSDNQ
jgi:RecB family exonuclease